MAEITENPNSSTGAPRPQSGLWSTMGMDSLKTPEKKEVAEFPKVGAAAPNSDKIPLPDGKPTVIVFLRHCGCPCKSDIQATIKKKRPPTDSCPPKTVAEKSFKQLTTLSQKYPGLHCIAVSHSSAEATERWIPQVGGVWSTDIVVDEDRDLYAQWGLGLGNTWHISGPKVLYSVFRLGTDEGIWNRTTESGTRWQVSGAFAVDEGGVVRYAHMSKAADDLADLKVAAQSVGIAVDKGDAKK